MIAPYNFATGGVELAHQLVDYLRNIGENAFIVYVRDNEIINDERVTEAYVKYNILVSTDIDDDPLNILVLPETEFDWIYKYSHIQLGCWWMSVDNRYNSCCFRDALVFRKGLINKARFIKGYFIYGSCHFKNSISMLRKEEHRITHYYQSRYAQYSIYSLGFSKVLPLSDFLNTELLNNQYKSNEKEDIVLYNPKKGYVFTKQIIDQLPDVKFIPMEGLSRKELNILFGKAKLYIDFGHFPGKDRMPREAVINGCCIMTGKLGASYFYEDVAISEKYKFDIKSRNIPLIMDKIKFILGHYDECCPDFDFYRKRIREEERIFDKEIEDIFL